MNYLKGLRVDVSEVISNDVVQSKIIVYMFAVNEISKGDLL